MIVVEDVWKSFSGNPVLKGLSLTVRKGETVVILGKSGVGKSVLLKQIIGLDKPDKGSITVDGQKVSALSGKALYHAIRDTGMLFQGSALFDSMTVGENVAFYLDQHGDPKTGRHLSPADKSHVVKSCLAMVGLEGKENTMPSDLSGGMRRRAAMARLVAYRPHILLYDEPTTGLDPITSMSINDLIVRTQKELNATSIVVTHDLTSAFTVGTRLAIHHNGKIEFIGTKEEFIKSSHPIIQDFLNARPELNLERGGPHA